MGIWVQGHVTKAMNEELKPQTRSRMVNIADDFTGWAHHETIAGEDMIDWSGMADDYIDFIAMCDRMNWPLRPEKTFFGAHECEYFGYIANEKGIRLAKHNLKPIMDMVPPRDRKEMRSVMGFFGVHRAAIKDFAMIAAPLIRLQSKNTTWTWGEAEETAFKKCKDECLKNSILGVPDYTKQFRVRWDAPCDGKGHVVYQLKDESKPDRVGNRSHIRYASKTWKPSLRGRPPYYLEGDAMIDAIEDGGRYARATEFKLLAFGDQAPLQWAKHCTKGQLNAWRIERLQECEYDVHYTPGSQNEADPISRYPMLGPRQFTRLGLSNAVSTLLKMLPNRMRDVKHTWAWANHDTSNVAKEVQEWEASPNAVHTRHPKEALGNTKLELGVLMPRADQSTAMAAKALATDRPVYILVPNDLVHLISQTPEESIDPATQARVDATTKVQLMAPLHTWLVANVPGTKVEVFPGEASTPPPGIEAQANTAVGTLQQWIPEQATAMASESAPYKSMMRTHDDGLTTVMGDDDRERIYVPPQRRMELYKLTHSGIGHLAAAKTYAELAKNYDWPTMRRDVRKWYKDCTFCELSKAKRHFANKKWSATEASPPRSRWGIDFYGMPDYEILGMIDMNSLHVELAACETRQQTNVEAAIEEHILFRHGVPDEIRSDHTREFIGTVMTTL